MKTGLNHRSASIETFSVRFSARRWLGKGQTLSLRRLASLVAAQDGETTFLAFVSGSL
jgi:hypothetical protein